MTDPFFEAALTGFGIGATSAVAKPEEKKDATGTVTTTALGASYTL